MEASLPTRWVSPDDVLAFCDRAVKAGVPVRVALRRASRHYGVDYQMLRTFWRSVPQSNETGT